ncbi:MAG: non-ribosomal peptide synthetase [Methanobrevibacter sp.]|jgi:aryl carrier-like protein|nr:non-ribosomal peptide synthetase [Candidatus Methanovirga basalitermitum]
MIPSIIDRIDSIPLNRAGKVDRKNIIPKNIEDIYQNNINEFNEQLYEEDNIIDEIYGDDSNEIKEELLTILNDIAPFTNPSINTDLIGVGLHSILQMEFAKRIYQKYSVDILENNTLNKDEGFTIRNITKIIENTNKENKLLKEY